MGYPFLVVSSRTTFFFNYLSTPFSSSSKQTYHSNMRLPPLFSLENKGNPKKTPTNSTIQWSTKNVNLLFHSVTNTHTHTRRYSPLLSPFLLLSPDCSKYRGKDHLCHCYKGKQTAITNRQEQKDHKSTDQRFFEAQPARSLTTTTVLNDGAIARDIEAEQIKKGWVKLIQKGSRSGVEGVEKKVRMRREPEEKPEGELKKN
ncbi:hypothetical protein BKA57DRAFT_116554 [Linnemannia elongata]|nr:hypothetical protein BKA57DRAFT_116554 [Linnemannia elongata]